LLFIRKEESLYFTVITWFLNSDDKKKYF